MALTASVRTDWAPTGASVTRVTRSPWTVKPVRVSVAFFVLLHIKPGGMKIFEKVFSGQLFKKTRGVNLLAVFLLPVFNQTKYCLVDVIQI